MDASMTKEEAVKLWFEVFDPPEHLKDYLKVKLMTRSAESLLEQINLCKSLKEKEK